MVRAFQPLVGVTDPLDVEIFTSGLLGTWWQALPASEDPEQMFAVGAVEYAVRRATPEAMAFVCAVAAVGSSAPTRNAAEAGVAVLDSAGVARPAWADSIGRVEVGDCWRLADIYGDQATIFCEFGYGDEPHALTALLDFGYLGGWIKDVWVIDRPAEALNEMRAQAESEAETVRLERITAMQARALLEAGFAATDLISQAEVDETFREFRALGLARCRVMPESPSTLDRIDLVEQPDLDAIVAEFLASPHAQELADRDVSATCARLIVEHGVDYDGGRVTRVSPAKTVDLFYAWLPRQVPVDNSDHDELPAVLKAWIRWAAARDDLPDAAVRELLDTVDECTAPGETADVLDRRTFVAPQSATRIGGEEMLGLDPADPDDRSVLIAGEHPEWHALLDDPTFDGEVDGVNPRLHLAIHEIVANQLWDNEPPEAWAAALRLLEAGYDRHEILHMLGTVVSNHIFRSLSEGKPADTDVFRRELDALGGES